MTKYKIGSILVLFCTLIFSTSCAVLYGEDQREVAIQYSSEAVRIFEYSPAILENYLEDEVQADTARIVREREYLDILQRRRNISSSLSEIESKISLVDRLNSHSQTIVEYFITFDGLLISDDLNFIRGNTSRASAALHEANLRLAAELQRSDTFAGQLLREFYRESPQFDELTALKFVDKVNPGNGRRFWTVESWDPRIPISSRRIPISKLKNEFDSHAAIVATALTLQVIGLGSLEASDSQIAIDERETSVDDFTAAYINDEPLPESWSKQRNTALLNRLKLSQIQRLTKVAAEAERYYRGLLEFGLTPSTLRLLTNEVDELEQG